MTLPSIDQLRAWCEEFCLTSDLKIEWVTTKEHTQLIRGGGHKFNLARGLVLDEDFKAATIQAMVAAYEGVRFCERELCGAVVGVWMKGPAGTTDPLDDRRWVGIRYYRKDGAA